LLIAVTAQFACTESRLRAKGIIRQDIAKYDKCWNVLMQDSGSCKVIDSMFEYTQALVPKIPIVAKKECRPMNTNSLLNVTLVLDIDQLLAQAAAVDIYLKRKFCSWGASANGLLPMADSSKGCRKQRFQQCKNLHLEHNFVSKVNLAKCKTMKRAVEKLHRSYSGNVSLLLDCCRQSVYIEALEIFFAGLKFIKDDEAVELVRVKNRLHMTYSSMLSAG
jgi:hypothetical protein